MLLTGVGGSGVVGSFGTLLDASSLLPPRSRLFSVGATTCMAEAFMSVSGMYHRVLLLRSKWNSRGLSSSSKTPSM